MKMRKFSKRIIVQETYHNKKKERRNIVYLLKTSVSDKRNACYKNTCLYMYVGSLCMAALMFHKTIEQIIS